MIRIQEVVAAIDANQKMTLKDAMDIVRFAATLTIVPTLMIALIACI